MRKGEQFTLTVAPRIFKRQTHEQKAERPSAKDASLNTQFYDFSAS